jgi:hypothetical protein
MEYTWAYLMTAEQILKDHNSMHKTMEYTLEAESKAVKQSCYMPWRQMGGEEV